MGPSGGVPFIDRVILMLYRFLTGAVLLPCLLSAPAFAEDLVTGSMPSEIRIEATGPGLFRVTNMARRYQTNLLASVALNGTVLHQLLEIEQSDVRIEGPEAETQFEGGEVSVRAYPLSAEGRDKESFAIKASGDAVAADGPYLTITRYGCCVEQPTHAVFSLETGAYLFNATGSGASGDWVTLGARGGFDNQRIIAQHVALSAADDAIFGDHKNAVIAIAYARRDQPLQRLALLAPQKVLDEDAMLNWMPQPSLSSAETTQSGDHLFIEKEGQAAELFTGITYRLQLDETTSIEIPITADHLDLSGARLPQGYSLVELPLDQPY